LRSARAPATSRQAADRSESDAASNMGDSERTVPAELANWTEMTAKPPPYPG
jgi:hypothetical protein